MARVGVIRGDDPVIIEDPGGGGPPPRFRTGGLQITRNRAMGPLELGLPHLTLRSKIKKVVVRDKSTTNPQKPKTFNSPDSVAISDASGYETGIFETPGVRVSVVQPPEVMSPTVSGGVYTYYSPNAGPIERVTVDGDEVDISKFLGVSVEVTLDIK